MVRASIICLEGPGFNPQSGHLFCLTTSEYTPCKTDTLRGMIKYMLGCLGKVPPDRSLFQCVRLHDPTLGILHDGRRWGGIRTSNTDLSNVTARSWISWSALWVFARFKAETDASGRSKIIKPFIEVSVGAARYRDLNPDAPAVYRSFHIQDGHEPIYKVAATNLIWSYSTSNPMEFQPECIWWM